MNELMSNILNISSNYYRYLITLENVIGVGLGYKWINGINTFEPCIHVLVNKKIDNKYLCKNNIIPNKYMGIITDVINVGNFSSLSNDSIPYKLRPLESGCAIGINNFGGTLGCIVTKIIDEEKHYYILSNNHVIADLNNASIGSKIIQPNFENRGNEENDGVAYLSNFIPLKFMDLEETDDENQPINYADCAIAEIFDESLVSNMIFAERRITGVSSPVLDLSIKKVGYVTGLTRGKITTIGTTIESPFSDGHVALFKNQILANLKSDHGDSGSVILNDDNEVLGLLFSGSFEQGITGFTDINVVLKQLKVEIYADK